MARGARGTNRGERGIVAAWNSIVRRDEIERPLDAISMLQQQHRLVERIFDHLERLGGSRDRRNKERLFAELAEALLGHAIVEERIFYTAAEEALGERPFLLHAAEEHLSVKRILADLVDLDAGDETFDAKLRCLKEQVLLHVGEEESQLFPRVRRALDEDQLLALAQEMTATLVELQEQEPSDILPAEIDEAAPL